MDVDQLKADLEAGRINRSATVALLLAAREDLLAHAERLGYPPPEVAQSQTTLTAKSGERLYRALKFIERAIEGSDV